MREIKFRGKRIDNGEWVCGMPVFDTGGQCYIITEMMSQITCCSDCGMPDVIKRERSRQALHLLR